MIQKVEVLISFPMGARFRDNLDISLYRELVRFIHDLSCFNANTKCNACPICNECRYYAITGENFKFYPGILVHNNMFEKKNFKRNEQKKFEFYFIGNNKSFSEYVDLLFSKFNQNLYGNFFYLKYIEKSILDPKNRELQQVQFSTCIESLNFSDVYNQMVTYYNEKYKTEYDLISNGLMLENHRFLEELPVFLKTKKLFVKGYVGSLYNPVMINQNFLEVGIGKFNCVGGGHIENGINV